MMIAARKYRAEWRLMARATTAAVLSFVFAEWLALPQGYWAVMTALIIVQLSLGGTIAAAVDRFLGTFVGAALAVGAAWAGATWGVNEVLLLGLTLAPLAFLAALYPGFRVAPLTAAIVLLATPSSASPVDSAIHRIEEIALGTLIGIAVSMVVFPSRARRLCYERAAAMLRLLGEAVDLHLQPRDLERKGAIDRLNDRVLAELIGVRTAEQEALRERAISLSDDAVLQRITHTLRRLRSDVAFIGRAVSPDIDWTELVAPLGAAATAFRDAFEGFAKTLREESRAPDLARLDASVLSLRTALSEGQTQSGGAANLLFVVDATYRDLAELHELLAPQISRINALPLSEPAA
jgi:uncharacterized membrane protein YccC